MSRCTVERYAREGITVGVVPGTNRGSLDTWIFNAPRRARSGDFEDFVRMEPCIIRSIGMVDTRGRRFSHRRSSSDYYDDVIVAGSRCVGSNILDNGGGRGRRGDGVREGGGGEGREVRAREEVKVASRRGIIL